MIEAGIRRKVEKFFAEELTSRIPTLKVFPNQRDESVDDEDFYAVARVEEAEETVQNAGVYYADVAIIFASHITESTSADHDAFLYKIEKALSAINQGQIRNADIGVRVYGWGPMTHREAKQFETFGDVITFRGGFGIV